jgi:hypothetical protein
MIFSEGFITKDPIMLNYLITLLLIAYLIASVLRSTGFLMP